MSTPEEIRQMPAAQTDHWQREIAAQLAEMNYFLASICEHLDSIQNKMQ